VATIQEATKNRKIKKISEKNSLNIFQRSFPFFFYSENMGAKMPSLKILTPTRKRCLRLSLMAPDSKNNGANIPNTVILEVWLTIAMLQNCLSLF